MLRLYGNKWITVRAGQNTREDIQLSIALKWEKPESTNINKLKGYSDITQALGENENVNLLIFLECKELLFFTISTAKLQSQSGASKLPQENKQKKRLEYEKIPTRTWTILCYSNKTAHRRPMN